MVKWYWLKKASTQSESDAATSSLLIRHEEDCLGEFTNTEFNRIGIVIKYDQIESNQCFR